MIKKFMMKLAFKFDNEAIKQIQMDEYIYGKSVYKTVYRSVFNPLRWFGYDLKLVRIKPKDIDNLSTGA